MSLIFPLFELLNAIYHFIDSRLAGNVKHIYHYIIEVKVIRSTQVLNHIALAERIVDGLFYHLDIRNVGCTINHEHNIVVVVV